MTSAATTTNNHQQLDKWTLNSAYYNFLNKMKEKSMSASRGYIKGLITKLCKGAGVTREDLRIYAGVRASLYFQGTWTSVSFDAIDELAEKGTDLIFIEKEGVPEVLTEFADKYGVALVNSRGYLTEYGKDLMKAANKSGAHVIIMTDYDISGIHIAAQTPKDIPWIGVDQSTLTYFNLDRAELAIDATNVRLGDTIRDLVKNERFRDLDINFLMTQRVEIDAVLAKVGGKRLWDYIIKRLTEIYPNRDYNRAIDIPAVETLYQKPLQDLLTFINEFYNDLIDDRSQEIQDELSNIQGMLDIDEKQQEIQNELQQKVDDDDTVKTLIIPTIERLHAELKKKVKEKEEKAK